MTAVLRVLTLVAQKGGAGKTTSALSLATLLSKAGDRCLVVDIDPQGSLSWFAEHADRAGVQLPFNIVADTDPAVLGRLREVANYDTVVVDTPGNLQDMGPLAAVVGASDYIILPCMPGALDVVAARRTISDLVAPSGRPFKVLLTRVDSRAAAADVADARDTFMALGAGVFSTYIRQIKSHSDALRDARLVTDIIDAGSRKAYEDYQGVLTEYLAEIARQPRSSSEPRSSGSAPKKTPTKAAASQSRHAESQPPKSVSSRPRKSGTPVVPNSVVAR